MRFFSAIPLPDELKQKVTDMARGRLPVPYINTTNLHVTLNFFGELDTDESNRLLAAFKEAVSAEKKFNIQFDKIVNFRNQIHVTLKPNSELNDLQSRMEKYFLDNHFDLQERPYYAYMKLSNMHMDRVMNRERKLDNFPHEELAQLNFTAERVVLYESKLLLHHPKHTPREEVKLI